MHLVAKFATNAGGDIYWPNLEVETNASSGIWWPFSAADRRCHHVLYIGWLSSVHTPTVRLTVASDLNCGGPSCLDPPTGGL